MTDKLSPRTRFWVLDEQSLEGALLLARDGTDVHEILHELDMESATENVDPSSCFTCGASPASADLHTLSLGGQHVTVCFRDHCQHHALDHLRSEPQDTAE